MGKQEEQDRRIDAALTAGRYCITSRKLMGEWVAIADPRYPNADTGHYVSAGGDDMVTVSLCNIVEGRCTVCLGVTDKPGCKECFSVTMSAASLEARTGQVVSVRQQATI